MSKLEELIKESKEIAHKLEISETKFRRLFEAAQDGIILIDPETDKIIDANPYLLELIGYSLDEVVGKELYELGAFKDIVESKEAFAKLKRDKYIRYEDMHLKRKDGGEAFVEFISNLYPINSSSMIQCNIRDITARKKAEKKAELYLEGLEKMNSFMTGREVKMADLKQEIERLKKELQG